MSSPTDARPAGHLAAADTFQHGGGRTARRCRLLLADPERGASISVLTAGLLVAAALFLGLVVDGGAKATALNRADATAQEAARAGVQAASTTGGSAPGDTAVDVTRAVTAAQSYLGAAGVPGSVIPVGSDGIRVTATITEPTRVLSMIGIDNVTVSGSADARVLYAGS